MNRDHSSADAETSILMHFFDVGGFGGKVEGFTYIRIRKSGILVPENGVEPSRPCGHRILSPARLPVPPLGHGEQDTTGFEPCPMAKDFRSQVARWPFGPGASAYALLDFFPLR